MANPLNIALISQNVWPVALKPSGLSKDPTSPPVLKYHFVTALSEGYQKHFEFARDEWRKYTYLEFSETRYPSNSDILITCKDEGGAKSNVGKLQSGKATKMTFGLYGCTQTTFLHEFGHALGFQHEHQRPGRESSGIHFCDKPHSKSWTENRFNLVDPRTLAAASLLLDKDSIMIYPIKSADIQRNEKLSATDKAFTMLMYPGRTPDDMTINQALNTAGIHVPTDDTDSEERKKGQIAIAIKGYIDNEDYESARKEFIRYNKKVLRQLKAIYIKHLKDKRDTESKKGAKSKKKSDVRTEGDFEDDFEDFLSTVIKEAVEWVANNPSEGNDNPESEEK